MTPQGLYCYVAQPCCSSPPQCPINLDTRLVRGSGGCKFPILKGGKIMLIESASMGSKHKLS